MNRVLPLLLIPLIVLGQFLAHSHDGTSVEETRDHASRPHVHLSVGHSHHHADHQHEAHHESDGSGVASESAEHSSSSGSLPTSHDSDAIYLAQNVASLARVSEMPSVDLSVSHCVDVYQLDWDTHSARPLSSAAPDRYSGLPIYLLVASLRL